MKFFRYLLPLLAMAALVSCGTKYSYETVQGDPLNARIYTLDNGLKVYMAVNHEEPRIQTYIAVRTGGKNDPAETTGMAHYFEHLMFKGTQQFGTMDYAAEQPMLDEIERLFETYRMAVDDKERAEIYAVIDSISYEASKIAIPNEYDKLMAAIGAQGTNAYTGNDQTVYVEDIPSNQIENWAMIEADRFKNPVIRGFHTELETIYEEKNMSLTNDGRKVTEKMLNALYPNHPYGTQTVLGTQEHLKNPSITNVKAYHATWYVPNNMAVCLAGDFDPDEMIRVIDKYFGDMKPNDNLPKISVPNERPITAPVVKEVYGLNAPYVTMAWRAPGATDHNSQVAMLAGDILNNGKAGLIDVNLNQQQKVLRASGYAYSYADAGLFNLQGNPKQGQSLDEVKDLLLGEVDKLRKGEFDGTLLEAAVNNYKSGMMSYLDSNDGRADSFVDAFINGISWKDKVEELDRLGKITKEDVVRWANENLKDDNYVIIYKRQGPDPDEQKMPKPAITPIVTNRDVQSDFLTAIQNSEVKPIEPVFVDYNKDLTKLTAKSGLPLFYKKNETTDLFTLTYMFEIGSNDNPAYGMMTNYIDYLGTDTKTAEEIKRELYNIACSYRISVGGDRTQVVISGLSEHMGKAMEIFEEMVAGVKGDENVLKAVKGDIHKRRENNKAAQGSNYNALRSYVTFGPEYVKKTVMTDREVNRITSDELIGALKDMMKLEHRILYYGPMGTEEVLSQIAEHHNVPEQPLAVTGKVMFKPLLTPENKVYLAQYDAAQIRFFQMSNRGEVFNTGNDAIIDLYNEYFGGGMNSIVFQEMREARGLAYSAGAYLNEPRLAGDPYGFMASIATQNDKMGQAMDAFEEIINDMPVSQAAFDIAKDALVQRLRTSRTMKSGVLYSYINAIDKGIDYDRNRDIFNKVQTMTLDDIVSFQQEWIKDRTYSYGILGDIKELDMNKLRSIGEVKRLSQEDIFGY